MYNIPMWAEIVKKLNTDFPAVQAVRFGDGALPAPPYCVVKQERDAGGRGTAFRIIAHYKPGQQKFLGDYIRATVGTALGGFQVTNAYGNTNKLYSDSQELPVEIDVVNDDGTISMERMYWMPDRL